MNVLEVLDLLGINEDCSLCGSKIYCLVKSYSCPTCGTISGNPLVIGISPVKLMKFKYTYIKPYS